MVNAIIFSLIITSLLILPLELFPIFEPYYLFTEVIEICITAIFTFEYIVRIYAAPQRLRYIFSWWGIIDLLSVLPYYISLAKLNTEVFRFVRLTRVVRILKIAHMKSSEELEKNIRERSKGRVGLMRNEEIEKVVIKHPIFFIAGLIIPLLLGTAALAILVAFEFHQVSITISSVIGLFALIFLYKVWLDYHYDVMYITNCRVIVQNEHLFGRSHSNVEFRDITNILPSREGIFAFLFGYGSIILETSSDQSLMRHDHIRKHEKIAQEIHEKCYADKRKYPQRESEVS